MPFKPYRQPRLSSSLERVLASVEEQRAPGQDPAIREHNVSQAATFSFQSRYSFLTNVYPACAQFRAILFFEFSRAVCAKDEIVRPLPQQEG